MIENIQQPVPNDQNAFIEFQRKIEIIFFQNFLQLEFSRDLEIEPGPASETDTPTPPLFRSQWNHFHAAMIRII